MPIADGRRRIRHVFLRDLTLQASIGVYPQEHGRPQRVRINVDLGVEEPPERPVRLEQVVDYAALADRVRQLVAHAHTNLVETMAERIAAACLADTRVLSARIRVEKLDVFADAESAGIEIERIRAVDHPPTPEGH